MKFIIDSKIFDQFGSVNIGVVVARNIDNNGISDEIEKLTRTEEKRIHSDLMPETLSQDPKINSWRKAYSSFGFKPKEAKSSVENLYKMVTRGIEIKRINKLVDIYNYICLKHMVPVGGEDMNAMNGDLQLGYALNEQPVKILGDSEPESPKDGEVIYKDDDGTICRCWNWREADRTKLTSKTQNAILVIEGLSPVTRDEIISATHDLSELITKYCRGTTEKFILDKGLREINL